MAQPPLSAAIRQLERDLGVDLFVRTTREVKPHRRRTRVPRTERGGRWRTPNGRPRTPSARRPASSGVCGSRTRGARASRRSRRSAGPSGQATRTSSSWRRRCGTRGCLRPSPTAASTSRSRSARRSPPSSSSPRYARSASSRCCPRRIGSRARRRSRSPRSPTRSSCCSRARSHRGCTTRSWRSTAAPASSRGCATSRSTRAGTSGVLAEIPAAAMAPQTVAGGLPDGIVAVARQRADRLARDLPGLARRRQLARRRGVRGGRALGLLTRAPGRRRELPA